MLVTSFHPTLSVIHSSQCRNCLGKSFFGQHHHILDECVTSLLLLVIFCWSTQMIIFILSNALTNGAQPSLLFLALILVKTGLTFLPNYPQHPNTVLLVTNKPSICSSCSRNRPIVNGFKKEGLREKICTHHKFSAADEDMIIEECYVKLFVQLKKAWGAVQM